MKLTTGGNLNILVVTGVIEMSTAVVCRGRSFLLEAFKIFIEFLIIPFIIDLHLSFVLCPKKF